MEIETWWRNTITGHEQGVKPSGGVHMPIEPRDDQSVGCGCVGTDTLQPLTPDLTASVLAAASLELKMEKQSAHSDDIRSVAFSPDGKTIVSGSNDKTLKVWDAGASVLIPLNPQPKTDGSPACCSFPGAQGGEAERAQRLCALRGLLARRQEHRVRLRRPDDQSVGCRCQR